MWTCLLSSCAPRSLDSGCCVTVFLSVSSQLGRRHVDWQPKFIIDLIVRHIAALCADGRQPQGPALDSARQNLASTFVNAFVNAGFGQDKLVTVSSEAAGSDTGGCRSVACTDASPQCRRRAHALCSSFYQGTNCLVRLSCRAVPLRVCSALDLQEQGSRQDQCHSQLGPDQPVGRRGRAATHRQVSVCGHSSLLKRSNCSGPTPTTCTVGLLQIHDHGYHAMQPPVGRPPTGECNTSCQRAGQTDCACT